ncbi:site-specific DNA-methyltransferase [Bacillus safensis]|uniref:site-specific DNA-methyltransferase n=1 Tax=Bacillus TaxID=1386 RepID=UPI00293C79FF|nr:site-specific DNA-methyltransferase [Bacillus safensis]MDV3448707.1 site-specific DNA-methyltransferase [Bacillus safensis]MEC4586855.1 site-specific DNA-methyltransferase [Bacillus safensis]MEC4627100.1 site-specific DNA-methyltransferase [Bacillus safensis]
MVNKMNGESLDITAQNIARLKELFPEILTDGEKIDFDMLKTVLGEVVETEQERYQFTWHGKKKMIEGTQKPSKGTLRPVPEKSKNFDTTENLYIEGDNLEVLKLLQKSYNGKIKMIYIDPPYNTGKDFVYKDNFKDGVQNYLEQTGQVDDDGNILSTNTESNGRFHTDWLNMMYARLKLARNLLADDGAIFISLDDNELENLKKICNEIFGESNFISNIIWEKRYTRNNDARMFSNLTEYILMYRKSDKLNYLREPRTAKNDLIYKNIDNDPRGPWTSVSFVSQRTKTERPNLSYKVFNPIKKIEVEHPVNAWKYSKEQYETLAADNRLYWGKDGENQFPRLKRFLSELSEGIVPINFWNYKDTGTVDDGTKMVANLLGKNVFDYPKPISLIMRMMNLAMKKDDIILDFFSGSATTAHAVMKLNAEDGGKRKFILAQIPERLKKQSEGAKQGYETICDIGEERIRRAGEKIKEELREKQQKAGMLDEKVVDPEALDVGFKVLKLDTSNIREWNVDFENLKDELDLYETPFVDERSELDIVYEIMLKQGLELTYPIETFEVNDKKVYDIAFGSLFICLSKEITPDVAKAMIARRDEHGTDTSSVIFSDAGFNNDSDKLNCIEILKDAGYPEDNLLTI